MYAMKKWATRLLKIFLGLIIFLILFVLVLHMPFAKRIVRDKVQDYVSNKTKTQFTIGELNYRLPKWIELQNVFAKDKMGDTLLYGNRLRVDISMLQLISGNVAINGVELNGVHANINRQAKDSTYNFQYIIDAFGGDTIKTIEVKKEKRQSNFSLDKVSITNSSFKWKDYYGGLLMDIDIADLKVKTKKINFQKQEYAIDSVFLNKVICNVQQIQSNAPIDNSPTTKLPLITLSSMAINQSTITYFNKIKNFKSVNELNEFALQNVIAKLGDNNIKVGLVKLNKSNINFEKNKLDALIPQEVKDSVASPTFVITVDKIDINNNTIVLNDNTKPTTKQVVDYAHLSISDFTLNANNLLYAGIKSVEGNISQVSFKDKSGFTLDSLTGNFKMDSTSYRVENVKVITPQSKIYAAALLYPTSFKNIFEAKEVNEIKFTNTLISKKDIALLAPEIIAKYQQQLNGVNNFFVTADIKGTAKQLNINDLVAFTNKRDFYVAANGVVTNAFDKNNVGYNINFQRLTVAKNIIEPFVNTKGKQQINLPPSITITGNANGSTTAVNTNLTAVSSFGIASIKGSLKNINKPANLAYNMQIVAKQLQTGKWINKDSVLGIVDGTIYVKGQGIDYKKASFISTIKLNAFRLQQYNYKNVYVKLNAKKGSYIFDANTNDPSLIVKLNGTANVASKYPTLQSKLLVTNANLYALGLYKDSLIVQTAADIDFTNLNPDNLNAIVRLDTTIIFRGKQKLFIDSLIAKGFIDSGFTVLNLQSSLADANMKGNFQYTDVGNIFKDIVAKYADNKTPTSSASNTTIEFKADVKPNPIYAILLPGLFFSKNIYAKGLLKTKNNDSTFYINTIVPDLSYQSNAVSNLVINVNGINDSLKFNITADTARASSILLNKTSIVGGFSDKNINADVVTKDESGKDKYALGITGTRTGDKSSITVKDKLKLNYADWTVSNKNKIEFGTEGFNISQLEITNKSQRVYVNSTSPAMNAPMDIAIEKFQLSTITSVLNKDSLLIGGVLNVSMKVDDLKNKIPTLDGTVKVDSLSYNTLPVGTIDVKATAINGNVNMSGGLTGYGNNVELKGNYNESNIDAQINLNPIQVKTIEPFSKGNLIRSRGTISGPINIKGTTSNPTWDGNLKFDSVYTNLAKYGTAITIENQNIQLDYPTITLNNFTVKDSANHSLIVNGTLEQDAKKGFLANLTVYTKDFIAVNSTAVQNNEVYGVAIVDVEAEVTGPIATPEITGNMGLKDKSNITYVRQRKEADVKEREGVMEFVDVDTIPSLLYRRKIKNDSSSYGVESAFLKYNLNIDIDKNAELNIIVDPITRDQLTVKGGAQLNAGVNPNGSIALTGAYNLTKGSYNLSYQFIKRKFELQEGSTIVFSGNPAEAEANITAVYEIEAIPLDLIGNEVQSGSIDDKMFKQKLPFQVELKVKGTLNNPQLSFDIKLKEDIAGVNTSMSTTIGSKLEQLRNDPSSLNKQVFALLVMNRFIGEQSRDFFAGGGTSTDQVIKESVSRFLSDAVNQIAADLIKGVDLNVDLKSVDDYATATQRTDLNLALSKRFLDDRLAVTVGKSFTVEGDDPIAKSQNNNNVQFLPDITTTYKLSKDGKYMIRAYRRNQYEAILDGYFIETGVVFSLTLDYNKFREILKKAKAKK